MQGSVVSQGGVMGSESELGFGVGVGVRVMWCGPKTTTVEQEERNNSSCGAGCPIKSS